MLVALNDAQPGALAMPKRLYSGPIRSGAPRSSWTTSETSIALQAFLMTPSNDPSRRSFLKTVALLSSATGIGWNLPTVKASSDSLGSVLPKRQLGQTGESVTMLGMGGFHTGKLSENEAQQLIDAAIEGGVRFFDTAVQYQDGGSERIYGRFLVPQYRDQVFIMTKTLAKTAEEAEADLAGSLDRLGTDRLDLWQAHSIESPEDAEKRAKNGVFDVMRQAKESGKVRHIGFTGHRDPQGHLRAIELFPDAETVQMPVNAIDPAYESFIEQVMPVAKERQLGVLAMKTLSDKGFFGTNGWTNKPTGVSPLIPDRISVKDAIRFAWSLPISVLITGADSNEHLQEKIEFARSFTPMSEEERVAMTGKVRDLAGHAVEFYKVDV